MFGSRQPVGGTTLTLMTHTAQLGDIAPPDTQVAAGAGYLVEFVNDSVSIWTQAGVIVQPAVALETFFNHSAAAVSDPRVVFDASSGRWIATAATDDGNFNSVLAIAMSPGPDPTQTWIVYQVPLKDLTTGPQNTPWPQGQLCVEPKLGYSVDKVTISCPVLQSNTFVGQVTFVFNKAQMMSGAPLIYETNTNDHFGTIPVISLTNTTTQYLLYNGYAESATEPWLGVTGLTGDPANNSIVPSPERHRTMAPTTPPADAAQQGSTTLISTGDDRLQSAVYQNGSAWTSAADNCVNVACLRMVEVDAEGATNTPATQDDPYTVAGKSLYYPAVSVNQAGDLFTAFSESSATEYPSAGVLVLPAGKSGSPQTNFEPPMGIAQGSGPYVETGKTGTAANRFGDYSSAAIDPCVGDGVWVAGEYAASTPTTNFNNWGTAAELVRFPTAPPGGSHWHAPECLGGTQQLTSGVSATAWTAGRLDVFSRGTDGALIHTWYDTLWHPWQSLGGYLKGDPGAVSWGTNRIDIFVRGGDDQLWHKWWDGAAWSGWQPLGGRLLSGPEVSSWANGRLDVFFIGTDHQLWHKYWDGSRWSGLEAQGGQLTADAGAVSWFSNRIDVFARGVDNQMWHKWWDGVRWSGWEPQGGILASGPTVASWRTNRLDVFITGIDGQLWHKWWDGVGWSAWEPHGGTPTLDPGAVSGQFNTIDVFYRNIDGVLAHTAWNAQP